MEVLTEVPQTGTKLRIDADRQFEGQPGDSVLRVQGEREGAQVFDACYVETSEPEAAAISIALRQIRQPTPELQSEIAREVQSTFGDKLGGRDAHQVAEIVAQTWWKHLAKYLGGEAEGMKRMEALAERFERAAARRRSAPAYATGGNGGTQPGKAS